MKWEELTAYRPLKKEEVRSAFKDFAHTIADNLSDFGFRLVGRKLIKRSEDLFHLIHIDTRGSWAGISEYFKTEICLLSVYDIEGLDDSFGMRCKREIKTLIPSIKNHYRITSEYKLLADYLTRQIIEHILPYFDKYTSSEAILKDSRSFKIDSLTQRLEGNQNLVLYCELCNHQDISSSSILRDKIAKLKPLSQGLPLKEEELLNLVQSKDWEAIDKILSSNKVQIFKKLKIKPV